jgi:hypothetical protein
MAFHVVPLENEGHSHDSDKNDRAHAFFLTPSGFVYKMAFNEYTRKLSNDDK